MSDDDRSVVIPSGALFGKGKGSSGGGGTESPDTLRSIQYAKIIDLLGEGTIQGLANSWQSVYFDSVQLQNPDGSYNFTSAILNYTTGAPNSPVLPRQNGVAGEIAVGVQIKTTTPAVRQINNTDCDRIRVTMAVPGLQSVDAKGNTNGAFVEFSIYMQANGGGYKLIKDHYSISGKTSGRYQRAITMPVFGSPPWDVRIVRNTADSTSQKLSNDLYWDSYAVITDAKLRYRNSAVMGLTMDSAQFSSIPQRIYEVLGLIIQVPNNYDPAAKTYTGVWNGGFQMAYSNNPAWIFYDLVTNGRYGIGDFIGASQVDKWSLYSIGQWCDQRVPDGKGGYEPRWSCNCVITDRQEAFDLLQSLASVFRGSHYWFGGQMMTGADKPADPVGAYTNASVINGVFNYQGSDLKARHTQVAVTWNDPDNLGQPRVSLVEDQAAISRYGLNRLDLIGIGCTTEGQAIRIGKWAIYTEQNETETVKFEVGMDGAWCKPGDIIQIADILVGGQRRGGRLEFGTNANTLVVDAPVTYNAINASYVSVVRADGVVVTVPVNIPAINTPLGTIDPAQDINPPPLVGSPWILSTGDIQTQLFRVIAVEQSDDTVTYVITALSHNPSKWNYVEKGWPLSDRDVTNFGLPTVKNLIAQDTLLAISGINLTIVTTLSWESTANQFEIRWRQVNSNWTLAVQATLAIDIPVVQGDWEFMVTPLSSVGVRGKAVTLKHTVLGLKGVPNDVKNFRIQNVSGMAHLTWSPATDIDVLAGGTFELRYSPRVSGVGWSSANILVTAIPGTATTVEVPYRGGTYMIKAKDTSGIVSANAALVIASTVAGNHSLYTNMCENPDWLGTHDGTFVQVPQQWLILAGVGSGLWDDQLDNIDDWPDVDVLPVGASGPAPGIGYYYFAQQLDMGGIFDVILTADLLAFPFLATSVFVDDRPGNTDEWQDWDAADADAAGMAVMEIRQTDQDPASSGAIWSAWGGMIASQYSGRGFQFRIRLVAPEGQNIAVEEACVLADFSAKQDSDDDVAWTGTPLTINYKIKFFYAPALAIAIQGVPGFSAATGDYAKIAPKSATSFTIELRNASNALIPAGQRTFDWQAQGY